MSRIVADIRSDLKSAADERTKESSQRFFKEQVKCHGVKTGLVGKIAKKYWQEIKGKTKAEIFELCEELFRSDYTEEAFVVSFWGANFKSFVEPGDLSIFERWIEGYINNWAKCDGFCNHTVGDLITKYPDKLPVLKNWARSNNHWLRRAAAVALIVPAKKGQFLSESLEISDILLTDENDMVQKGYGWLLKEESRKHQGAIFDYVMKNKSRMPRTSLRYAIELMPKGLRTQAMKK